MPILGNLNHFDLKLQIDLFCGSVDQDQFKFFESRCSIQYIIYLYIYIYHGFYVRCEVIIAHVVAEIDYYIPFPIYTTFHKNNKNRQPLT